MPTYVNTVTGRVEEMTERQFWNGHRRHTATLTRKNKQRFRSVNEFIRHMKTKKRIDAKAAPPSRQVVPPPAPKAKTDAPKPSPPAANSRRTTGSNAPRVLARRPRSHAAHPDNIICG